MRRSIRWLGWTFATNELKPFVFLRRTTLSVDVMGAERREEKNTVLITWSWQEMGKDQGMNI